MFKTKADKGISAQILQLAAEAASAIDNVPYSIKCTHGMEVVEGFFTLYNDHTGQSKVVLYHPESNLVFKRTFEDDDHRTASRRYLGKVTFDDKTYGVRLPEHYTVEFGGRSYSIQEYVNGEPCGCSDYSCEHANLVKTATRCNDAHTGNWSIVGNEIILFDFEGING